jgi:MFS family permease
VLQSKYSTVTLEEEASGLVAWAEGLQTGEEGGESPLAFQQPNSTYSEEAPDFSWEVDLLCAVPYVGAAVGNLVVSWHSDHTGERKWHLVVALVCAASGFAFTSASLTSPVGCLFALTVTASAIWGASGPFWGLVHELTPCDAEANVLIPMINSIGSLGGLLGPFLVGFIRERSKTYRTALMLMAILSVAAAIPICSLDDGEDEEVDSDGDDGAQVEDEADAGEGGAEDDEDGSVDSGRADNEEQDEEEHQSESDEEKGLIGE